MKALIIGFGSIGRRHAEILDAMDEISQVFVLSGQENLPFETITSLPEIPTLGPDYVVIASSTAAHFEQLAFLEKHLRGKKILVEKPLFDAVYELPIRKNQVFVGYNLRFHPIFQTLKEAVADRRLWNIQVTCGSYLPDWRPGRDYRTTYSANGWENGGGVLLDLSHELDYVRWLVGSIKVGDVVSTKVSDLKIAADDLLLLNGETVEGAYVHISLNYFSRKSVRQVIIDGKGISIVADLIGGNLSLVVDGQATNHSWPVLERNGTYRAQHKAVLEGEFSYLCTYQEGVDTMRLIDSVRASSGI